ncbi:hypothetical protein G8J22_02442 [Lentilactobacillus hilgardii]|uniref:hypothetical protein n=1 Tax=Lentilactobacillus hilgardii TaxID=1588 RepID=UPI00019C5AFC|nr:hypothetical protein [Lentilactobacillus hilgardii]EEI19727.1 hypothetical protein HMPREF0497_1564 [Lentilactobacillus buchneri ATCC 11577]MCT3396626.1 hypothetical protein [Lentilactobacillus hilgardii]QIR10434.1 hypothetical protein G8J22_02442 [Lentilactobacillus hilgardii]
MNKKMVDIKKQIKFLMLLIPSMIIGFATTMISTNADSGYTVVKKIVGNNPNSAYHLISKSKNIYLWNSNHTKVKANLKHYKNYSWRYYDQSVILSHNSKKSVYYYVQGITPNGNEGSKLQGIVWHGSLTPGVNPNYQQLNNINFRYFNTDKEYLNYIQKSPSQKLTRKVLKLFPNTQLSIQLTKAAGGASAWDFNDPTVNGYKDFLEFPTAQKYFNKRFYKRNISDNARFKLIKSALDKSGYDQTKRTALDQYQIGIYYYSNPHRLITDEAPGFTIGIPE